MHADFFANMDDDRIIQIVRAADNLARPLAEREEGDDEALVEVMNELRVPQGVVDKLLIVREVLRESAHRGLQIPRSNDDYSYEMNSSKFTS